MHYYYIHDLERVGKTLDNNVYYLYNTDKGWIMDSENIIMDRLIGYDGERIGSSEMLFRIDEISEVEANKKIQELSKL